MVFLFRSVCFFTAAPIAGCSPLLPPAPPFHRQQSHPAVSPSLCLPPFTPASSSHQGMAVLGCSFTARESRLSWEPAVPAPPPLQPRNPSFPLPFCTLRFDVPCTPSSTITACPARQTASLTQAEGRRWGISCKVHQRGSQGILLLLEDP